MDSILRHGLLQRRQFLRTSGLGIGAAALSSLLVDDGFGAIPESQAGVPGVLTKPHYAPTAKRVIYLYMSGAPSQLDLFDHKPTMVDWFDKELPDSVRGGQRLTTMTSGQKRFPIAPSMFRFDRHGDSGAVMSELLPHTASIADELCIVKSMHTEAINHDPAITYMMTGHQVPGRPSVGAWLTYGLGSLNRDLPAFVVLHSSWSAKRDAQALYERLWGAGFLPSRFAGVSLRSQGDPVLYLSNPPGVDASVRRTMIDAVAELNQQQLVASGDPEIAARISQYEMAYRMQSSVPELSNLASEPKSVLDLYGSDVTRPGTFAYNCLMARRLAERNVRFIQVFIRGWDQHGSLPSDIRLQAKDVDQPCAALIKDLKQRGMLDDTLVVWGGEFGRTIYCQGGLTKTNYGRDHHPRCFCIWLAGGGVKRGITHGETDEFGYNVIRDPIHIHDLNATMLHCLGIDHERLTHRFQGRDFRLTDVHGKVVRELLA